MADCVETMAYFNYDEVAKERFVPWHGLGTEVDHAMTSKEALELAGLDWTVEQRPIFIESSPFTQIPGYVANVRDKDNKVLGVVTPRYKVVQNAEAFEFTDNLIGGDVKYVTAGSLKEGRRVWMLAQLPRTRILGDDVDPYICFSNSHDGTGTVKVCMTPIRVVCNNTLNLALESAKRCWSTRHMGNIESKLNEAKQTLQMADTYMAALNDEMERLANITLTEERVDEILKEVFPIAEDDTDRKKRNMENARDGIIACYFMPDISKFMGTALGLVNAASDFATHSAPVRETETYYENNWGKTMDGHPIIDRIHELVCVR